MLPKTVPNFLQMFLIIFQKEQTEFHNTRSTIYQARAKTNFRNVLFILKTWKFPKNGKSLTKNVAEDRTQLLTNNSDYISERTNGVPQYSINNSPSPSQNKFSQCFNHFEDLEISEKWKFTSSRKRFLPENDRENSVIIFATSRALRSSASCKTVLSDGTFKWFPPVFKQIYVIFGANERKVPLVFSFLSEKSIFIYRKLFDIIFKRTQKNGCAHPNCNYRYRPRKGHL